MRSLPLVPPFTTCLDGASHPWATVLQGGTLRNYWSCLDRSILDSRHVKSIVNTAHALAARCAALCRPFQADTAIYAQQTQPSMHGKKGDHLAGVL